uniref:Uncharacterized protein n=1 Tax=Chromera velia CCMP2878 TaxID=1169474 RepID=A0A0G4HZ99_9ALVE|eukprot:Cvel_33897.t1-p1 / transcript=Cvel_33897.t1 / gene=Cvel_33897 / organism=Chromera_velia_CCMP2878 / gene_product=hypothetical protein / transcript_product=hypothetical protein / location=Cvel_scaffold5647:3438-4073(+) / protein_length=212 / sequence_SO=supercontig / SO=protein_coding / is_pseudo=false
MKRLVVGSFAVGLASKAVSVSASSGRLGFLSPARLAIRHVHTSTILKGTSMYSCVFVGWAVKTNDLTENDIAVMEERLRPEFGQYERKPLAEWSKQEIMDQYWEDIADEVSEKEDPDGNGKFVLESAFENLNVGGQEIHLVGREVPTSKAEGHDAWWRWHETVDAETLTRCAHLTTLQPSDLLCEEQLELPTVRATVEKEPAKFRIVSEISV